MEEAVCNSRAPAGSSLKGALQQQRRAQQGRGAWKKTAGCREQGSRERHQWGMAVVQALSSAKMQHGEHGLGKEGCGPRECRATA